MNTYSEAKVDSTALRKHYRTSTAARTIYDYLSGRKNARSETKVDLLEVRTGVARSDVVAFFKALQDYGCGTFVVGRGGHPSRFQWAVSLADVARVAAGAETSIASLGEAADTGSVDPEDDGDPDDRLIEHLYQLRPNLQVTFELPASLTEREAERISGFIRSLPFGGTSD